MFENNLKPKGGSIVKTSNGAAPVSPEQRGLFPSNTNHKLWVYAVIIYLKNSTWVKFGDHRCATIKEAEKYAYDETLGKLRGLGGLEIAGEEDIKVIAVKDVTDSAISFDPMYNPTLSDAEGNPSYRKSFDNVMRPFMPGTTKQQTNPLGGSSNEVHRVDDDKTLKEHTYEWNTAIDKYVNGGEETPKKIYDARPYLIEAFKKISSNHNSMKFLLAPATGTGKETSTLSIIIYTHDVKGYDEKILHTAVATIPSTTSELFEEMATVSGMNVPGYGYIDFERIVPYLTKQWYDAQYKTCKPLVKTYIDKNVKIVNSTKDIPAIHSSKQVPVLFGGWHDLALKANDKFHDRYKGLKERIGILGIGEAHQMLGNNDNKMVTAIKKNFPDAFFLAITGTPYDLIYSGVGAMYFDKDERTLYSRNEIYKDKKNNPDSPYKNFPDYNYYKLSVEAIVNRLKKDPNWKEGANGFTWTKFLEYDADKKQFKYEESIVWYFKRKFGMNAFGYDPLSIHNAKDLCEEAKKHVVVALPVGTKNASAKVYINALQKLLEKRGAVGNYKLFDAYEHTLGDRKRDIESSNQPTITLTCIKDCTGANIPAWGSFVFMRPLGDSIKFWEQATGRPGRPYFDMETNRWKRNCGIFIADLEASIELLVSIEEKIQAEQGQDIGHGIVVKETLENYNFFNEAGGSWEKMEAPALAEEIEKLSTKSGYTVKLVNNRTEPPSWFNQKFQSINKAKKKIDFNSNNNSEAKNKKSKTEEQDQLNFEFDEKGLKDRISWWNNLKEKLIARLPIFCFNENLKTVSEAVELVETAIDNNDKQILNQLGDGAEYFPLIFKDEKEFDNIMMKRLIEKFQRIELLDLYELLEQPVYSEKSEGFVAESTIEIEKQVRRLLQNMKQSGETKIKSIIDDHGGRGTYIIYLLLLSKEYDIDIDPKTVYYNDIEIRWVKFFKEINEKFNLEIPTKNISCLDANATDFEKRYNMKFHVQPGNPAYDSTAENSKDNDNEKHWNLASQNALQRAEPGGYVLWTTPRTILQGSNALKVNKPTYLVQKEFENKQLLEYDETSNEDFDVGHSICSWLWKNESNNNTLTKFTFEDGTVLKQKYIAGSFVNQSVKESIINKVTRLSHHEKHKRIRGVPKPKTSEKQDKKYTEQVIWNSEKEKIRYTSPECSNSSLKLAFGNYKSWNRNNTENLFITKSNVSNAYWYIEGSDKGLKDTKKLWTTDPTYFYVGNNYKNSKGVVLFVQHQRVIPMLDMSQDWSNPEKVMDEFNLNDEERAEIYDYYKKHFK